MIFTERTLKRKILIESTLSQEYIRRAVEFARAKGFVCESAVFPVTSFDDGEPVPASYDKFSGISHEVPECELPEGYEAASDHPLPIQDFDWRSNRGLETLFTKGEFLTDNNLDQLPDEMNVCIVVDPAAGREIVAAACNLAFRLGMETTAYDGRLLYTSDEEVPAGKNVIRFTGAGPDCAMTWHAGDEITEVEITGRGTGLLDFTAYVCEHFPQQGPFDTWADRLMEIAEGLRMRTVDGQLAYLKTLGDNETVAYVNPEFTEYGDRLTDAFPKAQFVSYKDNELRYEHEYDIEWEVDALKEMLETRIYPAVHTGDRVTIRAAVSEDKEVRAEIADEIRARLESSGADIEDITVLCSYKQGYSWLDEQFVPSALNAGRPDRIEVYFKEFLPPGVTEWNDEFGAIPNYNNIGGDPDHWYDMPIRFLQELYPVEDAIVARTGIEPDNVIFRKYEGDEDITYYARALDSDGRVLFEDRYLCAYDERPYLDMYPGMGKVHPSTGYVRAYVNGSKVAEERIKSDVENIWDVFQQKMLPELKEYSDSKLGDRDPIENQPYFSRMVIEASVSEPNEHLASREDLFSSLDALHEDFYFVATDFFKNYGYEKCGQVADAPGLILPKIQKAYGKPTLKVSVYGQCAETPVIKSAAAEIVPSLSREDAGAYIRQLSWEDGRLNMLIDVDGAEEAVVKAYAQLLAQGVLELSGRIENTGRITFAVNGTTFEAVVPDQAPAVKDTDIRDIDISEYDLIGYEQGISIIDQLKRVPGISVYRTTRSYLGRELYAVEFMPDREGYVSRTKRITSYPTELINCRHHANEVSSTNSAFMLIRDILTLDKYKDITEHMNLVIVPMENVDGTAIHYELQKDNPTWKLHIARFNAIGKEFYHDHFKIDTMHTESYGLTRLFMRLLPDFVIDNHGVPSHEWEQQFSGYTSPSFKGFWLPRSLLYGYFYHIKGDGYESNIRLCEKMQDVIADDYLNNEEVTRENKLWARQFEKYAHGWMPNMFPADYYKNMINYWIGSTYNPEHRYPSIRYPWILSVDYVSEVADETAQGEYLNRCARAHLAHDHAIIDMICNTHAVYRQSWSFAEGEIGAEVTRKRPVISDYQSEA